jgi:SAM-dependent methyltransferase
MKSPDYSPFASEYARSRPTYPAELFAHLASLVHRHDVAWDCATGNGQAALGVVEHFDHVIATDVSDEQIAHAAPHPRIEYRVAGSEHSGLDDGSADLVTVASAIHWFDLESFYSEVRRVMRPGGVLAVWTYHVGHMEPPFDDLFARFYRNVLQPYFAPQVRLVDERYEGLTLPGETLHARTFHVSAQWDLGRMIAFIKSWSGTQRYLEERGEDPVALIAEELECLWGGREREQMLRWPLYARISRL